MAGPGPCPPPLLSCSISCGRQRGLIPASSTYLQGGGAGSSGPGDGDRAPAFLGVVASDAPRGRTQHLGGRKERPWGERPLRQSWARKEEPRGVRPGDRRLKLVAAAAPGTSQASPRDQRRPANLAAAPAVRASAATGSRARPEAESCGCRDAG